MSEQAPRLSPEVRNMPIEEIVTNATIKASSLSELNNELLTETLNKYTFAIVSGLIDPDVVKRGKAKLREFHSAANDNPATGEKPSDIMGNFQKLSIGGAEHSGVYRPRCMRTFYNPFWDKDIFGLHEAMKTIAKVRNILYGFAESYAIDEVEAGFWTATRFHHYPAGGGFLVSHVDNVVPVVQRKDGLSNQYFQPVLMMSKKGKDADCDFSTGGGFFSVGGKRYFYESDCEIGDIVIYSGRTIHGVADIDLHKTFNTSSTEGRFAGFVTLYREFSRKGQLVDYVGQSKNPVVV